MSTCAARRILAERLLLLGDHEIEPVERFLRHVLFEVACSVLIRPSCTPWPASELYCSREADLLGRFLDDRQEALVQAGCASCGGNTRSRRCRRRSGCLSRPARSCSSPSRRAACFASGTAASAARFIATTSSSACCACRASGRASRCAASAGAAGFSLWDCRESRLDVRASRPRRGAMLERLFQTARALRAAQTLQLA